jgi:hypothetical protein
VARCIIAVLFTPNHGRYRGTLFFLDFLWTNCRSETCFHRLFGSFITRKAPQLTSRTSNFCIVGGECQVMDKITKEDFIRNNWGVEPPKILLHNTCILPGPKYGLYWWISKRVLPWSSKLSQNLYAKLRFSTSWRHNFARYGACIVFECVSWTLRISCWAYHLTSAHHSTNFVMRKTQLILRKGQS